jgi:hypothetical protein
MVEAIVYRSHRVDRAKEGECKTFVIDQVLKQCEGLPWVLRNREDGSVKK